MGKVIIISKGGMIGITSYSIHYTKLYEVSTVLPATPKQIYEAWLSSEGHSKMTGSQAEVEGESGGTFKAWDGYIWGKTLELEPNRRILQAWRTSEFPEDSPDSQVEILLEEIADGTKVTLNSYNFV